MTEIRTYGGPTALFAGGARAGLLDNALLTLDSEQAAQAAAILSAKAVVPVHFDQWAHFTEGRAELERAFAAAGSSRILR